MSRPDLTDKQGSRPVRLLFAVSSLVKGSGGIAELSRQILAILLGSQRQIDLHVCVLEDSGLAESDNLTDLAANVQFHFYSGNRLAFSLGLLTKSSDWILFDHVGLARFPGWLPKPVRPPYIVLIHGVEIWKQRRKDYHRSARNAEMLIANSEYTKRKSTACYRDLPPVEVCLPGMKAMPETVLDLPDSRNTGIGPRAMLIVGRLDTAQRHKGHDQLLDALPHILIDVPDAQLVIAGSGSDKQRLQQKALDLGISDQVIFAGWCNEAALQSLLTRSAVFVMPSDGDGFGLVFLEAMMHGLACVGLANSAAEEVIIDGQTGVLVDRDDTHGMAKQLAGLLIDANRRLQLGQSALQHYKSHFTERHYEGRLLSALDRVIDGISGPWQKSAGNFH